MSRYTSILENAFRSEGLGDVSPLPAADTWAGTPEFRKDAQSVYPSGFASAALRDPFRFDGSPGPTDPRTSATTGTQGGRPSAMQRHLERQGCVLDSVIGSTVWGGRGEIPPPPPPEGSDESPSPHRTMSPIRSPPVKRGVARPAAVSPKRRPLTPELKKVGLRSNWGSQDWGLTSPHRTGKTSPRRAAHAAGLKLSTAKPYVVPHYTLPLQKNTRDIKTFSSPSTSIKRPLAHDLSSAPKAVTSSADFPTTTRVPIEAATNGVREGLHAVTQRMNFLSTRLAELTQLQWSLNMEAEELRKDVSEAEAERNAVRLQLENMTSKMGDTMKLLSTELGEKQRRLEAARTENARLRGQLQLLNSH